MPADSAFARIGRFTLAVELHEGAGQHSDLARRRLVIALERGFQLACDVGATHGQVGIGRVAEILHAFAAVLEVGDARQVAPAAMTRCDHPEHLLAFADDVEAPRRRVRAGGVHGEIAAVMDLAFLDLLEIKRTCLGEHGGCDLSVTLAHMRHQPGGCFGRKDGRRRKAKGQKQGV